MAVGGPIYRRDVLELIEPTTSLHTAWLQARDDWGPGVHEDGFGLLPTDEVDSPAGFTAWVARLLDEDDPERQFRCTYRWIVEDGEVQGGIALRHATNDFTLRLGHIGYGVRPGARRRGLATWALGRILDEAKASGMRRVLLVCEADNLASAKTIERNGGMPAGDVDAVRRYWITL